MVVNLKRWATGNGPILLLLSFALLPVVIGIAIVRYQPARHPPRAVAHAGLRAHPVGGGGRVRRDRRLQEPAVRQRHGRRALRGTRARQKWQTRADPIHGEVCTRGSTSAASSSSGTARTAVRPGHQI